MHVDNEITAFIRTFFQKKKAFHHCLYTLLLLALLLPSFPLQKSPKKYVGWVRGAGERRKNRTIPTIILVLQLLLKGRWGHSGGGGAEKRRKKMEIIIISENYISTSLNFYFCDSETSGHIQFTVDRLRAHPVPRTSFDDVSL